MLTTGATIFFFVVIFLVGWLFGELRGIKKGDADWHRLHKDLLFWKDIVERQKQALIGTKGPPVPPPPAVGSKPVGPPAVEHNDLKWKKGIE